jgi:release factor glutamine methyltransferase
VKARDAAASVRARLAAAGVADAYFEAEYLVRSAAGIARSAFYVNPELDAAATAALEGSVARRELREPAPYITGTRHFWDMEFAVGPGVLVPRPETELLVEVAVEECQPLALPLVVDVGTGSGCIAIATARAVGGATVVATDVSDRALAFARANRDRHRAPVCLLKSDLAAAVRRADVVLANLPYIASGEIDALEPEVSRWEPRVALDGGGDGFNLIRRLVADCGTRLRPRLLALEVGYGMAASAVSIAEAHGASTAIVRDFAGIERIVCCRWP